MYFYCQNIYFFDQGRVDLNDICFNCLINCLMSVYLNCERSYWSCEKNYCCYLHFVPFSFLYYCSCCLIAFLICYFLSFLFHLDVQITLNFFFCQDRLFFVILYFVKFRSFYFYRMFEDLQSQDSFFLKMYLFIGVFASHD